MQRIKRIKHDTLNIIFGNRLDKSVRRMNNPNRGIAKRLFVSFFLKFSKCTMYLSKLDMAQLNSRCDLRKLLYTMRGNKKVDVSKGVYGIKLCAVELLLLNLDNISLLSCINA